MWKSVIAHFKQMASAPRAMKMPAPLLLPTSLLLTTPCFSVPTSLEFRKLLYFLSLQEILRSYWIKGESLEHIKFSIGHRTFAFSPLIATPKSRSWEQRPTHS